MANFNTHLHIGFITSATLAIVANKAGALGNTMLISCTVAGTLGSLLPDIDLEHSKPVQIGFNILSIIMAFWAVIIWGNEQSLLLTLLLWSGAFIVMRYGILYGYSKSTVHRGVVHSVPYMAILAVCAVNILHKGGSMTALNSWLLGTFIFFGGLVHLILDEIYSVNILNLRVKRSFGSAFKIFEFKKWYFYVFMYILLAALIFIAPSPQRLWIILSDPMTWLTLKQSI